MPRRRSGSEPWLPRRSAPGPQQPRSGPGHSWSSGPGPRSAPGPRPRSGPGPWLRSRHGLQRSGPGPLLPRNAPGLLRRSGPWRPPRRRRRQLGGRRRRPRRRGWQRPGVRPRSALWRRPGRRSGGSICSSSGGSSSCRQPRKRGWRRRGGCRPRLRHAAKLSRKLRPRTGACSWSAGSGRSRIKRSWRPRPPPRRWPTAKRRRRWQSGLPRRRPRRKPGRRRSWRRRLRPGGLPRRPPGGPPRSGGWRRRECEARSRRGTGRSSWPGGVRSWRLQSVRRRSGGLQSTGPRRRPQPLGWPRRRSRRPRRSLPPPAGLPVVSRRTERSGRPPESRLQSQTRGRTSTWRSWAMNARGSRRSSARCSTPPPHGMHGPWRSTGRSWAPRSWRFSAAAAHTRPRRGSPCWTCPAARSLWRRLAAHWRRRTSRSSCSRPRATSSTRPLRSASGPCASTPCWRAGWASGLSSSPSAR
mmetsp:Transcript_57133/g.177607  ORF Transcript_57133/g.177607 Transcript_57133/m.177607 type:complete len:470 (+) Transcript_57133:828-2237(+)